jgi:UDP-2,4-diacetamido-2,4,6-trideoxy-beta-L-altropyranose hydrolase
VQERERVRQGKIPVNEATLLFRADANPVIGTGHVMRCLALAQAWQEAGGRSLFALADPSSWAHDRLQHESMDVLPVSASPGSAEDVCQTIAFARDHAVDWVVIDGYQFGMQYQMDLKSAGLKLLFLDDYGHAHHYYADLVLNQNASADERRYQNREPYTRLLLGSRYCLLRREFAAWRDWRREIAPIVRRVLVTMGGSDPDNVTELAILALHSMNNAELQACVIVGGSNPRVEALEQTAAPLVSQVKFVQDVPNISEWMAWADVAISAAGTTCWELCRTGLPAILVSVADNQFPVGQELQGRGCAVHLGRPHEVSPERLASALARLTNSWQERQSMSSIGRALVDGQGARRVRSVLLGLSLCLRPASANDERLLWEWANDADVRAASFSPMPVPWETHATWFDDKMHRSRSHILIAEDESGRPFGQVRLDVRPAGGWEIHLSIAPHWRGRGLAAQMITEAVRFMRDCNSTGGLHAFVKPANLASVRAFDKCAFHRVGMAEIRGNPAIHFMYSEKPDANRTSVIDSGTERL